ncbi:hypothetical protein DSO57_1019335 [Entomophthora muscae]|uniref:Uncharacterized protein n=1 Tax=Entomophthora muscae TaxID=34485 RepID=A0ACC2SGT9_9FUNG|nr:hypothetical protein DSO57_1019335 [Entomophthora muscae]
MKNASCTTCYPQHSATSAKGEHLVSVPAACFLDRFSDYKKNTLVLKTLKLGQFREGGKILGEKLVIEWKLNDSPATQYDGKLTISITRQGQMDRHCEVHKSRNPSQKVPQLGKSPPNHQVK